eukprot:CAMPEP_0174255120 /NCGR_PEP_ID=MMETSP0439-20130205/4450_1 /TAXON_ID=0 /ORGANISM="Stereomyxa ramosa, Strain Chinc5" /LENGTH=237 /DNA_ID=CAMNT_0015337147 /DNA_START=781 /DNA_END=1494 /DNA_ORIENTATION=+
MSADLQESALNATDVVKLSIGGVSAVGIPRVQIGFNRKLLQEGFELREIRRQQEAQNQDSGKAKAKDDSQEKEEGEELQDKESKQEGNEKDDHKQQDKDKHEKEKEVEEEKEEEDNGKELESDENDKKEKEVEEKEEESKEEKEEEEEVKEEKGEKEEGDNKLQHNLPAHQLTTLPPPTPLLSPPHPQPFDNDDLIEIRYLTTKYMGPLQEWDAESIDWDQKEQWADAEMGPVSYTT